jgi:hypothetical protein
MRATDSPVLFSSTSIVLHPSLISFVLYPYVTPPLRFKVLSFYLLALFVISRTEFSQTLFALISPDVPGKTQKHGHMHVDDVQSFAH